MLHIHIQITGIPKIVMTMMTLVMAVVVYLFGAKGVHFNFTFFIEAYKRKSIHQHQYMYINFRIFARVYMCIQLTIMCSLYVCERVKGINKK